MLERTLAAIPGVAIYIVPDTTKIYSLFDKIQAKSLFSPRFFDRVKRQPLHLG